MSRHVLLAVLLLFGPACELIVGFDPSPESGAQCTDGVDNDGDLLADCEDDGCADLPECQLDLLDAQDDSFEGTEDAPLSLDAASLLENDSGPDGAPLTVTAVSNPEQGAVVLEGATITFTPDPDFNGQASFVYTITDGSETDDATVNLTFAPVNDPPVADAQAVNTEENTSVSVTLTASDIDGDGLSFSVQENPQNGVLSGAAPDLTYTPNPGFSGPDSFTFLANDGAADSNIATVSIDVGAVNDPPVAADDAFTTNEDTDLVLDAPILLGNDIDPDGDPLSVVSVENAQNGTVVLSGGVVIFTPSPDFFGAASFDYTITDGQELASALVTVTVDGVNDAPVAADDTASTDEDVPLVIPFAALLLNDIDVDGDTLQVIEAINGPGGSVAFDPLADTVTFTPSPDASGDAAFLYTIADGIEFDTATVTVNVAPVDDLPIAIDDSDTTDEDANVTTSVLANDQGLGDGGILVSIAAQPTNGTAVANADNTITYTPNADFFGSDSYTYSVEDFEGDLDVALVTITVNPVDDQPLAAADSDTTDEDIPVTTNVLANDQGFGDGGILVTVVTQPANGTAVVNADNTVTYTPDAGFNGSDSYVYQLADADGDLDSTTVSITVNNVNSPPQAVDDAFVIEEDTDLFVDAPDMLGNDIDPDGDTLIVTGFPSAQNGSGVQSGDGLIFTPTPNFSGNANFTYTVEDGNGGSDTGLVAITVNAVADPPSLTANDVSGDEDTAIPLDISASLVDLDGSETLSITLEGVPVDAILSAGVPQGGGGGQGFAAALNFPMGDFSGAVAVGDLNADSLDDVVTANFNSGNVSVRLGDGAGGFGAAATFDVNGSPFAPPVLGRFNSDPFLDIVSPGFGSNDISVLFGDGAGGFSAPTNIPTGSGPLGLAVGDFNGDTLDDVIVGNRDSNDISVLLGTGSGLGAPTNIAVGTGPRVPTVGDFDNDGDDDIATSNQSSNNVSVLLGNGDGTFLAPVNFAVGTLPEGVTVGEFNGDGLLDLATANLSSGDVSVLLGNGDGTFLAATNFAVGLGPRTPVVGRFNNDAFDDIAVASANVNSVGVLLGNGDGTFLAVTNFAVGANPQSVAVGEFNGDAAPDLVAGNTTSDDISLLLNESVVSFLLTEAELVGLTLTPPPGFSGPLSLTVTATSTEASNGDLASQSATFTVTVNQVAVCGDGILQSGEECDDGNTLDGDGCDANCLIEGGAETLLFSEYIEGSSFNKVVEIFNPSTTAVDLIASACSVNLYSNGSATPSSTVDLGGVILPGGVLTLCNGSSVPEILAVCNTIDNALNFNGDDAIELVCGGATLDVIGQIGLDPGTLWGVDPVSTRDNSIRRKCGITAGDTIADNDFNLDLVAEWDGFPIDTLDGLGAHDPVCP